MARERGGRSPSLPPGNLFFNEDCISGARRNLPGNSVDLIITDPPYGIGGDQLHVHYNRDEGFVLDGYVEVPAAQYDEFSRSWIREAARVLRPGGSIYIVSGYTHLGAIISALEESRLSLVNHVIWKYPFGVFTRRKFISSHYHILFYEKAGHSRTFHLESRFGLDERGENGGSLNYQDREDVWTIPREYKPGIIKNKNELPLSLLMKIIQYSSNEGDTVCDFFLGSFSTARAAIGLGRRAIGFEISTPLFQARIGEIEGLSPGFLLPEIRVPEPGSAPNAGNRWSPGEKERLIADYEVLKGQGVTHRDGVGVLSSKYGRGRWAVEKVLHSARNGISKKL